jgi:2-dehydro-3-deoxygluconokinase
MSGGGDNRLDRLDMVTFGEVMVLLLAEQVGPLREATTFRRMVAGAEANVAIGMARLGRRTGWFGRVGEEEFGRAILFRLRGEGLDVSRAKFDAAAPSGLMIRERREVGPLDVIYYRRNSAASRLSPADLDADYIASARYLHLTGITPALSASCRETSFAAAEIARSRGVTVTLDPNLRLKLWTKEEFRATVLDLARRADIILPGHDEAEILTGESDAEAAARALLAHAPTLQLVVIKMGERGTLAVSREGQVHAPAVQLPRVVDPVGAGDAFAAGFLTGQLRGMDLAESLALANRCGAWATTAPGDIEVFARWEEVASGAAVPDVKR